MNPQLQWLWQMMQRGGGDIWQYLKGMDSNTVMQILTGLSGLYGLNQARQPWNLQMAAANRGVNPAATAAGINIMTQPLSREFKHAITSDVAPGIAGSGVATAPGTSEQILARAMAPYQLQEQQMGQQAYFAGQEMPFKVGSGTAGEYPFGLASLFSTMQLMQIYDQMNQGGGYGGFPPASMPPTSVLQQIPGTYP